MYNVSNEIKEEIKWQKSQLQLMLMRGWIT